MMSHMNPKCMSSCTDAFKRFHLLAWLSLCELWTKTASPLIEPNRGSKSVAFSTDPGFMLRSTCMSFDVQVSYSQQSIICRNAASIQLSMHFVKCRHSGSILSVDSADTPPGRKPRKIENQSIGLHGIGEHNHAYFWKFWGFVSSLNLYACGTAWCHWLALSRPKGECVVQEVEMTGCFQCFWCLAFEHDRPIKVEHLFSFGAISLACQRHLEIIKPQGGWRRFVGKILDLHGMQPI